jgi:hypothetical protein
LLTHLSCLGKNRFGKLGAMLLEEKVAEVKFPLYFYDFQPYKVMPSQPPLFIFGNVSDGRFLIPSGGSGISWVVFHVNGLPYL